MPSPAVATLNHIVAREIASRMGLSLLPTTDEKLKIEGLNLLTRVGIDASCRALNIEHDHFKGLSTTQKVVFSTTLGVFLRGAQYLENQSEVLLRRSGVVSNPGRRDSLNQIGRILQWTQHEVIQFTAIVGALQLCALIGIEPSDSLFTTALSIALSEDIGALIAENIRPHPELDKIRFKRREIEVYAGYPPLTPNFSQRGIEQWKDFILALPLFNYATQSCDIHQQKTSLQIVRQSKDDPLRGIVFFVVDTRTHASDLKKNKLTFLRSYFSEKELQSGFGDRIRKLDDNPLEQAGKVADIIEIKKAIWTFITGKVPDGLKDWSPHEIQLSRDPVTYLASVSLSPRLERLKEELYIGEIRMTWTDQGYISLGIISFRHRDQDPLVIGTGIDITDTRSYWRHAEGHWPWANARRFFPPQIFESLYGKEGRPSPTEIAERHAISEAVFKALYPYHPQAEHNPSLYQQFGPTPRLGSLQRLVLTGESLEAAQKWGADYSQTYSIQMGSALISVATLHKK